MGSEMCIRDRRCATGRRVWRQVTWKRRVKTMFDAKSTDVCCGCVAEAKHASSEWAFGAYLDGVRLRNESRLEVGPVRPTPMSAASLMANARGEAALSEFGMAERTPTESLQRLGVLTRRERAEDAAKKAPHLRLVPTSTSTSASRPEPKAAPNGKGPG